MGAHLVQLTGAVGGRAAEADYELIRQVLTTVRVTRVGRPRMSARLPAHRGRCRRTDVGRVRQHNEDARARQGTVYVVADGMGGHAAGEVASRIAVETVVELADAPGRPRA